MDPINYTANCYDRCTKFHFQHSDVVTTPNRSKGSALGSSKRTEQPAE